MSGKLVVRYKVDRQGQESEVQVIDRYFVHLFVPENLETLPLAGPEVAGSMRRDENLDWGVASIVVFLSDGEATNGENSSFAVKNNVATTNSDLQLPIFSVTFGRGADFSLRQDISAATDSPLPSMLTRTLRPR